MTEYLRFLPDFLLGVGGTAVLLGGGFFDNKAGRDFVRWLTLVFFVLSACGVVFVSQHFSNPNDWGTWTPINTAFALLFLCIGAWVVLAEPGPEKAAGEWYALFQFAVLGMIVLARSANLAAFFLGLETLSLALYILVAFRYRLGLALRGGVMYLVLASFASAFLAFGIALVYAAFGTLEISPIAEQVQAAAGLSPLAAVGFAFMLVGIGFKLAIVPFHMWAPDVYEAAPAVVSGVIASASKGATLAALLSFAFLVAPFGKALAWIAALSMIGGNLLGLLENRVKRILAYSSIAHVGYLLTGFLALGHVVIPQLWGLSASTVIFFYVLAYALAALGAFAVLGQVEREEELTIRDLRGMLKRHPLAAWLLMIFVVSLAGIPPTVGFLGKLFLFLVAVKAGYLWLVLIGLVASAIGVYYYVRILAQLFMSASEGYDIRLSRDRIRDVVLTATAVATVVLGILPTLALPKI